MNLPDWLSLSATSGTGSSKITATVDSCTARAARRTTAFSVKTASGSSRMVKVIQNGIAEFVNISTQDINLPAVLGGQTGSIAIAGTSNSAILTVLVGGTLQLTSSAYTVTDKDGNSIAFVSGSPIEGDPGAEAQYSFSLVFNYIDNPTNEVLSSSVTVMAQSGDSASINVSQAAGSHADITVPIFTINEARSIGAAATDEITPAIVVYDPNEVGWDILAVPSAGITFAEESTTNFLTPISVNVEQNVDTENGRSFVLYLVPEGAVNTSVVYSSIVINQAAAPVNPYIEGDVTATTYAGGEIAFRVVDQKGVGWYPNVHTWTGNEGSVLITGVTNNGTAYEDALAATVFAPETGNERIVGDGTVKVHMNAADEEGAQVTFDLCVSLNDIVTEPYDTVTVTVTNKPQFDIHEFIVILPPNRAYVDNAYLAENELPLFTLVNPNGVPFVINTSGNSSLQRKATIYANGSMVYDETDGVVATTFVDTNMTLDLNISGRGVFVVSLKSPDGITMFDTATVKVYRQPVIRFAEESTYATPLMLCVTETLVNNATPYAHYGNYSDTPTPQYDDADILSNVPVSYSIVEGEPLSVMVNGASITGLQVIGSVASHRITLRAYIAASETEYYTEAYQDCYISVSRTAAYIQMEGYEEGTEMMVLYRPPEPPLMPGSKELRYSIYIDKYIERGVSTRVPYETVFPDDVVQVNYTINQDTNYPIVSYNALTNSIEAVSVPTLEGTYAEVTPGFFATPHFECHGVMSGNMFFTVTVVANLHYVLFVQASWEPNVEGNYLFYDAPSSGTVTSKPITIMLKDESSGNVVQMDNTVTFTINGQLQNEISTEGDNRVIYNGGINSFVLTRDSQSSAINVPAESHTINVSLNSNIEGQTTHNFTIKAYSNGEPLGTPFTVYMMQKGSMAQTYRFALHPDDVAWYEASGNQEESGRPTIGLPCHTEDSPHQFRFHLESDDVNEDLSDKTIYVTKEYYVYDDTAWSTNYWREGEGEGEVGWFHFYVGQYEVANYTTGQTGYPEGFPTTPMTVEWQANNDASRIRKCVLTVSVTDQGVTKTEHYTFVQLENTTTYFVRFEKDGEVITNRVVDTDYSEEAGEQVEAHCYMSNSNGVVNVDSTHTITYESTMSSIVSVDDETSSSPGLITVHSPGEARIIATAKYSSGGELVERARGECPILVTAPKAVTVIYPTIPDATYLDADTKYVTAWSSSGAQVSIQTNSSRVVVQGPATVEQEQGHLVTKLPIKVATATTANPVIVGNVPFTFSCEAIGEYEAESTEGVMVINKFQDYITNWDTTGQGTLKVGQTKTYTIETFTGRTPKWLISSASAGVIERIGSGQNTKSFTITGKGVGDYTMRAELDYDSNFGNDHPRHTYSVRGSSYINRTVSFTQNSYPLTQGGSIQIAWAFNPSSAKGGTKTFTFNPTGIVSVTNIGETTATLNALAQGSTTMYMTVSNSGGYDTCTTQTVAVSVGATANNITFTKTPSSVAENGTAEVKATATYGQVYYYIYSGDGSEYASVDSNTGIVTGILAGGPVTVTAKVYGTSSYSSATATHTMTVTSGSTPPPSQDNCEINILSAYTFNAPGETYQVQPISIYPPTGTTVRYSSSNPQIVSVDETTGWMTAISTGNATITATAKHTGYTDGISVCAVQVKQQQLQVPIIYVDASPLRVYTTSPNNTLNLQAHASNNGALSYTSLNNNATVDQSGNVTGVSKGKASIRIDCAATSGYTSTSDIFDVTVASHDDEIETDNINFRNNNGAIVAVNDTYFNPATADSGRDVMYASSNTNLGHILKVNVSVKNNASASTKTLTMRSSLGNKTRQCSINISSSNSSKSGQTLNWTTNSQTFQVKPGDTFYIYASLANNSTYYGDDVYISWEGSDSDITYSGGVVTVTSLAYYGISKFNVTAHVDANASYTSASKSYEVTTSKIERWIELTYPNNQKYELRKGQILASDFNVATVKPTGTLSYSTSSSEVATVNNSGVVTGGTNAGDATITVTADTLANYTTPTITYDVFINAYEVKFMNTSGTSDMPIVSIGGRSQMATARIEYRVNNVPDTDRVTWAGFSVTKATGSPDLNTVAAYHIVNISGFGFNKTNQTREIPFTVQSLKGGATGILTIQQGVGDSGSDADHAIWVITRSNSTTEEDNTAYATGAVWNLGYDAGQTDNASAGTDEDYEPSLRLSHESGTALWFEVQQYNKRNDTSTMSIHYEVSVSSDGTNWTTTSAQSWFHLYFGDGNSSNPTYGSADVFLGANGKLYPHISWDANNTGSDRYGRVQFYIQQGQSKLGLWEGTFWQHSAS